MAKKLKAPPGTDEANIGTQSFRVDNDHNITVPDGVDTSALELTGGFVPVVETVAVPLGTVLMKHATDKDAACSFEKSGDFFAVPAERVAEMMSHGFLVVESSPVQPAEPAK
ncbi:MULTISPECIES: hypothetical protein [unclassified Bradyrhizobium]|uniref:hypothetical protein n=1 Tax=unclassified Bradyrhizobium TaxID=2631580 RepID=UPI0028E633FD|nr:MULTISPECIES: hypothetical protein [unclassified Bradyrhizobium]